MARNSREGKQMYKLNARTVEFTTLSKRMVGSSLFYGSRFGRRLSLWCSRAKQQKSCQPFVSNVVQQASMAVDFSAGGARDYRLTV